MLGKANCHCHADFIPPDELAAQLLKGKARSSMGQGAKKNLSCGAQMKKNRSKNFGCLFSLYSLIQMVGHSDHK